MHALDMLAVAALAVGAYLGARKGLWRLAAGCSAVGLGALAGWAVCDALAAALRDWAVGSPGDRIVGFFLPFALTSVYARFIIGLWLSRRLEDRPAHNRAFGAAAGLVWMVFFSGLVARVAGLDKSESTPDPVASAATYEDEGAPLTKWLARWPGAVGARVYLEAIERGRELEIAGTLQEAMDAGRARRRAGGGDAEAITAMREAGYVRLGMDSGADSTSDADPDAATDVSLR
jgi:uncharacterized membrane protein required for colicin V production